MRLVGCFLMFLGAISVVWPAFSADMPDGVISVHYAFAVGTLKPVSGESFCRVGKDCSLGIDFDPVMVTLQLGKTP
jgi:hypothetical protein